MREELSDHLYILFSNRVLGAIHYSSSDPIGRDAEGMIHMGGVYGELTKGEAGGLKDVGRAGREGEMTNAR